MDSEEDILLAKWLNHTITPEELKLLEKQVDLSNLKNVLDRQTQFDLEVKDTTILWNEFQEKIEADTSDRPKSNSRRFFLAALILMLLIAGFFFFKLWSNQVREIKSIPKETKKVELADGTQIQLSPDSKIFQHQSNWSKERKIDLEGQAFFEVSKGVPFSVKTSSGIIDVLGTSFSIWSAGDYMSVQCFEGHVKVSSAKNAIELRAGQEVHLNNRVLGTVENFDEISPSWIEKNQHIYKRIPVRFVIKDIERFIGLRVETNGLNLDELFSGLMSFENEEEAARYLGESMGWNYVVTQDAIQFSN